MKEQLKQLRKAANLSQKEAAKKIGVVQSTVSMWETGRTKPETQILPIIANVYNCSVSKLFDSKK